MKSFLVSKTVWFGLGQILYGIVGLIFGWVDSGTLITLITTGITTIGLRSVTTQPLG